ncbi:MAG: signal peptidase I [Bacteroidetes bacterium]|nr:signal peptidase I [Bacteroidota bacterium]
MSSADGSCAPVVAERRASGRNWFTAAMLGFVLAIIAGLLLRTYVVGAVHVPSRSMERTVLPGDFVLVNKLVASRPLLVQIPFAPPYPLLVKIPGLRPLRVGDVLVIRPPSSLFRTRPGSSVYILKRCVGTPGDTLVFDRSVLTVNGRRVLFPETAEQRRMPRTLVETEAPVKVIVGPDTYYLLGDNPGESVDSRTWGPVPAASIVGSAAAIYWSVETDDTKRASDSWFHSVRWDRIGRLVR